MLQMGLFSTNIQVRKEFNYDMDAFTSSTKSYLMLFLFNRRIVADFVKIVYETTLEHYCDYHNNYEHLILMKDGVPMHYSNT